MKETTRPYRMTARAVTTARTATAILDATWELFADKPFADITLADIAVRSGVRTQTVLRRFGDKDAVFAAMLAKLGTDVVERRGRVRSNDIDDIVANLVDNYELSGRLTLKMLAEAATTPAVRDVLAAGRTGHRKWCMKVFSGTLAGLPRAERKRRLAQLIAICDVHTWEVLRITSGLSSRATKVALTEMLAPLVVKHQRLNAAD
jgi:AcrR family transcriptional regulator